MNIQNMLAKKCCKPSWGLLRRRTSGSHPAQRRERAIWLLMFLFLTACTPATAGPTNTPAPEAPSTQAPAATQASQAPLPQAEHRIGIRQANGKAEFYDKVTDETFIVRGVNYVFVPSGGTLYILKVGTYDPDQTREDFAKLASLGYNTARVFLDFCNKGAGCIGDADNVGLNPEFLDNIADMMLAARETGIYILFTSNDLPDQGGYSDEANRGSGGVFAGYRNSYYLRPQAISATRRYWRDLLTGLVERNAAFDAVLGWQLLNEQWMFKNQPPLSLTSGTVETTTGTYDMADPEQKKQMVSDGLVYYIAQMKEEILLHDPTALVTMGFFIQEVAPDWNVETASLLQNANLDFFDFHAYPGPISLQAHANSFGMLDYDSKLIIMGEYGAFRHLYDSFNGAARALTNWVTDSCDLGFDGWLYWTYNAAPASAGDQTWGLTDENGFLLELFAPFNQPDPCTPVDIASDNIAYGKPAIASASLPAEPPSNAVDEDTATQWGAGAGPVQWISVDLGGLHTITEVRLLVAQYPEGNTMHHIQVRATGADGYSTVHEFSGETGDGDWLVFAPDAPIENVGFIRIHTVTSPSWVAWKEIQVFGEPAD